MFSLTVLGDFTWDVIIRTNSKLLKGGDTFGEVMLSPGGSAANVAVWAQRAGLKTRFIGKIGRDRLGQLAKEDLASEGLETLFIQTNQQRTGSVAVFVDEQGERSMVSGHGADFFLLESELPKEALKTTKHLHLTAWSFFANPPRAAARASANLAKANNASLSFDPSSFQIISEIGIKKFLSYTTDIGIDIIFPNFQEGQVLTGLSEPRAIAKRLSEIYKDALIVLKLDAKGALILEKNRFINIPATSNNLIDATGAGDSFAGAFLAQYLKGKSAEESAIFANLLASWVIEQLGARPKEDNILKGLLASANIN